MSTTELLDAVSWLNDALRERAGQGLHLEQLRVIVGNDSTARRHLLNDLATVGGRGSEIAQAAAEVLKTLEDI
jgi:hypothetical protein